MIKFLSNRTVISNVATTVNPYLGYNFTYLSFTLSDTSPEPLVDVWASLEVRVRSL